MLWQSAAKEHISITAMVTVMATKPVYNTIRPTAVEMKAVVSMIGSDYLNSLERLIPFSRYAVHSTLYGYTGIVTFPRLTIS